MPKARENMFFKNKQLWISMSCLCCQPFNNNKRCLLTFSRCTQQTSGVEMKVQVKMERVRAEASLDIESNPDVVERQEDSIDNYDLRCRELSSKLGRMKLTGAYYGGTSLNENQERDSSRCYLRFYCAIVLLGQWTFFAQAIISLFYEGLLLFAHL